MGQFEINSGAMVCSDPCYTTDVWCMQTVKNVKNGTWIAEVETVEPSGWGERIGALRVFHSDYYLGTDKNVVQEELAGTFGVDSGQFGFFDADGYRKDESVREIPKYDFGADYDREEGDEWYRACAKITLSGDSWGTLPKGVVSSSGLGDGSYSVTATKNADGEYVAFEVVFIDMSEEDEEFEDEIED